MENNPYYVLMKHKKPKKREKNPEKEAPNKDLCHWCKIDTIERFEGYYNVCKSCREIDQYIDDWSLRCMEESCKPKHEQDPNVYLGRF